VSDGQHYDDMPKVFFEHLELPQPDIYLGVGSGSHGWQTGQMLMCNEEVLLALWNRHKFRRVGPIEQLFHRAGREARLDAHAGEAVHDPSLL